MSISWLHGGEDERHMRWALAEAELAAQEGEVPVGAIVVHPEMGVIARAHNEKERLRDATAHAEVLAIGQASEALGAWRLAGTTVYSTLEPCPMCAGALIQARVARLVFGARDPKAGAVVSVAHLLEPGLFNHDIEWEEGVLDVECGAILSEFFRGRRGGSGGGGLPGPAPSE